MKRVARKANSLSFFFRTMGKDPQDRVFSIFGNRLRRPNNKPIPPIMSVHFTMVDPNAHNTRSTNTSLTTSKKVKFNARKKMKKVIRRSISISKLNPLPKELKSKSERYKFSAIAVKKVKNAVRNINRLASLIHFYHFESDEHDHGIHGPASKVESLSHLLNSLRTFYDPDNEHIGNPHYSDLALLQREAIKWNPRIRRILNKLWNLTDKDHDACIEKNEYIDMCMKVYRAIVDDNPDPALNKLRRQYAKMDWEGDHMGYGNLNRNRFTRAWFQLADHWTHDISSNSYADFLEAVYYAVAIKSSVTQKVYWKPDDTIRHFSLHNKGAIEESDTIHLIYEEEGPKCRKTSKADQAYIPKKKKIKIDSKVLMDKKFKKIESKYQKRLMKVKVVEDSWMNKSVKTVYHHLEKLDLLDEEVHLSSTAAKKSKSGLYKGSTIAAPKGWENLALAPWSTAFHRINLDQHSNAAIDELARSKILASVRAGINGHDGRKQQFLLSDLTSEQRQVQRLILLDLREKYMLMSKNNNINVNPEFFNRIDSMMKKSYSVDNIDPRQRAVYQSEPDKLNLQRPSSAPNLQLFDKKSIVEYLNNHRKRDKRRPSTAGTRRRKKRNIHLKLKKVISSPPKSTNQSNFVEDVTDNEDHGGLVVFTAPPSIFGSSHSSGSDEGKNMEKSQTKKRKKRNVKKLFRKKITPLEKERQRKRTITIKGLSIDITTKSIRSTLKCWNQNVHKIKRDSADTVKIIFVSHRDFKNSMNMLKILAQSKNSEVYHPQPKLSLLSRSYGALERDNSFAVDNIGEEDDCMYGLSQFRPLPPPTISPIKIPKYFL
jgi:hypothetical protein